MLNEELKDISSCCSFCCFKKDSIDFFCENQNEKLRKVLKDNENFITAKFYPYLMASKIGHT